MCCYSCCPVVFASKKRVPWLLDVLAEKKKDTLLFWYYGRFSCHSCRQWTTIAAVEVYSIQWYIWCAMSFFHFVFFLLLLLSLVVSVCDVTVAAVVGHTACTIWSFHFVNFFSWFVGWLVGLTFLASWPFVGF